MISTNCRRTLVSLALVAVAVLTPVRVFGGPPLICHPFDIGTARTLPGGSDHTDTSTRYDRSHLVADTLALLGTDTPILVRMETIRRAAIHTTGNLRLWRGEKYTDADRNIAAALIAKLRARTTAGDNDARALALFDLGFFAETLRQTELDPALDGYALILKAAETKDAPEIQFALALASLWPQRTGHADHLARARVAAQPGSPLAVNLASHFGKS